jgi:hypothetical protein
MLVPYKMSYSYGIATASRDDACRHQAQSFLQVCCSCTVHALARIVLELNLKEVAFLH